MTVYGYARVSTDGQNLAVQDAALHAAGCAKVYSETASGAKTDRAALAKVIGRLREGDVLIVTRLDRLARSTRDLLNTLDKIAKAGAGFRSLADAWADTTTPHGRLMLTVLGGLAEFERELIRARTGEVAGAPKRPASGLAARLRSRRTSSVRLASAVTRARRWSRSRGRTPSRIRPSCGCSRPPSRSSPAVCGPRPPISSSGAKRSCFRRGIALLRGPANF